MSNLEPISKILPHVLEEIMHHELKKYEHMLEVELGIMADLDPKSDDFKDADKRFNAIYNRITPEIMPKEERLEYWNRYEHVDGGVG